MTLTLPNGSMMIVPDDYLVPCADCGAARHPETGSLQLRHAPTCPTDLARTARRAAERARVEEAAAKRTFTDERFDAGRPVKETARLLLAGLKAAAEAGALPSEPYRVTVRDARHRCPTLVVWVRPRQPDGPWGFEPIHGIADRYNRTIARYDARDDERAFRVALDAPATLHKEAR